MRRSGSTRPWKAWKAAAVLVSAGLVFAACGGSSKKSTASGSTTTTAAGEETTSTTAGTTETSAGAVTTTTAAAGGTTTTVRKTATTVKNKTTGTTTPKSVANVGGGITKVTAPPTTAVNKDIQSGGTVTLLKAGDITGFDPALITNSGSSDAVPGMAVFDMLVYTDPTNGSVVPQTAESLTSTDALVWTLKLHPNIKFTDGTPYDAAAVKFNYARLQDPNNHANRAAQANLINTMDVIDNVTLKITLKAKNAEFPIAVALIPFIGSPAAFQAKGANFSNDPVGAGPFTLKSWTRDSQQVYARNPNYWNAPRPFLDQLILKPVVDEGQRINTFIAGQANMTFVGAPQNADQINKSGSGTQYTMILNGGINLYFNTKKGPFADVRARQAVAMAIDFNEYSKVVDSSLVEPIDSIFRHDSPFYDPTILQPAYNSAQAQTLFNQVAAANGGTLSFTMTAFPSQNYAVAAQYIQGVLNKYNNVKMSIVTEATALHITNCTAGNYDSVCEFGNIFDDPEPTWTGLYTCNAVPNPTFYCNAKFDADVADNQSTLDANKRIADIKDAQKVFYADMPSLYVERRYSWVFAAPNIQDFHYADDGMPLVDRVWIKTHG